MRPTYRYIEVHRALERDVHITGCDGEGNRRESCYGYPGQCARKAANVAIKRRDVGRANGGIAVKDNTKMGDARGKRSVQDC
jgi:hypothetical protein